MLVNVVLVSLSINANTNPNEPYGNKYNKLIRYEVKDNNLVIYEKVLFTVFNLSIIRL